MESSGLPGRSHVEARLTRYLLGVASQSERERLEAEYFSDEDAFEKMLGAEDDLIDAYARGELSNKERRQFEDRFLNSAQGRERVQFARTLAGAVTVAPPLPQQSPTVYQPGFFSSLWTGGAAWRLAAVSAALVLMVVSAWLLFERAKMRAELYTLRAQRDSLIQESEKLLQAAETERARSAESTAQIKTLEEQLASTSREVQNPPRDLPGRRGIKRSEGATQGNDFVTQLPAASSTTFDLNPGSVRSEGSSGNSLKIPRNAKQIVLRLGVATVEHEYYRAVIETADGDPVKSFDSFKPTRPSRQSQRIVLPPIPVRDLPANVYVISLQGKQPDGSFVKVADYSFSVTK